jgi:hypothetical protein
VLNDEMQRVSNEDLYSCVEKIRINIKDVENKLDFNENVIVEFN